jgi:type III secretion system FlhB-like substrate exporter
MHLPLKSIEQAYGSNHHSGDNSRDKNSLSKKSVGEMLLRRAMENDSKIEDDAELMQKLRNLSDSNSITPKHNSAIEKIVENVNKSLEHDKRSLKKVKEVKSA